jgi:hypothetical protein
MADPLIHVQLDLDPRSDPIEGALTVDARLPEPFIGWIELAAALERLRTPPTAPARPNT